MSGYARRPGLSPLSRARSLIIPDDEKLADLEEANPFSFKEFLKTKNLSLLKEGAANSRHAQEATRHSLGLDCGSPPSQPMGFGLEFQQPFFEDPTGAGDLLDEDEDEDGWNGAYLPSTVEQTHARVSASASPCSTYISFFSSPSELAGPESLPPWTLSDSDSRVSPMASPSADFAAHGECLGDRHLRTLQMSYEALKDENSKLRRKLTEVQSFSESQTEMVRTLERKLEAKMIKEESDYHDLESVVQQVEQNLELMTVRTETGAEGGEPRHETETRHKLAPGNGARRHIWVRVTPGKTPRPLAGPSSRRTGRPPADGGHARPPRPASPVRSPSVGQHQDRRSGGRGGSRGKGLWGPGPSAPEVPVHHNPPRCFAQAQVSNFRRENEALRSGQGASLAVVKQNTDVALQNLRMVMSNAHTSIKQLVSGAETLNLVAEILKSIDRISEIKEVGEEES